MVVGLAVGPALALEEVLVAQLRLAVGAREVLLVPCLTQRCDHLWIEKAREGWEGWSVEWHVTQNIEVSNIKHKHQSFRQTRTAVRRHQRRQRDSGTHLSDNGLVAGAAHALLRGGDALLVHVLLQVAQHGVELSRLDRLGVRRIGVGRRVVGLFNHGLLQGGGVELKQGDKRRHVS